jgi:sulfate-transporting ATPase
MTTILEFAALGLGAGATYSLLAMGIISIYRASGVLNLAQGALAMVGAAVYYSLHVGQHIAFFPAALLSIALVCVLGLIMSLVVMQRLRTGSALMKLIATVAVLIILESAATLIWSSHALSIPESLPSSAVHVGALVVGLDRLVLFAIALTLTAILSYLSRFTRIGVATTAVAENQRALASLGWSPIRISTANWVLGAGLAALAGILIAPISELQVESMTWFVVPALAVALLANFESYWLGLLAAILLGIAQSEMGQYVHVSGLPESLPFAVIIVVLILRGRNLPVRGFVGERLAQIGTGRIRPAIVVPSLVLAVVLITSVLGEEFVNSVTLSIGFGVVFLSIVVLTGYTGQLSLGQMALAGIGALIAGRLVATTGTPFFWAMVLGVGGTVLAGMLFAIPALRIRGPTLAIVTLALGVVIVDLLFNPVSISGGDAGTTIPPQRLLGIDIDPLLHPRTYAIFALICFLLCATLVTNVRRSRVGRSLIAVRSNERAAAALGVSVTGAKIYAFGLSAAIAGLGGIVIGFAQPAIVYEATYGTFQSVLVVAFGVIGGVGYVGGTLFAAQFPPGGIGSYVLEVITGGFASWIPLAGGIGLLLVLLQNPNGMASATKLMLEHLGRRMRRRGSSRRSPAPLPEVERRRVEPARLVVSGLSVHFGATKAVQDVSLDVGAGEVVGLIGPNGAGKTTLLDAVSGFVRPVAGDTRLSDERIDRLSVHRRARAGVGRSFQSLELFEDVTVRENLRAASDDRDLRSYFTTMVAPRNRPLPAAAVAAIREFGLEEDLERLPTELPYGRRRLVAVARAVASEPSIVLLDEPAAGLRSDEAVELAKLVRRLADDWGVGVLVVEHDMSFVMGLCDKVVVLDFGRKIAEGTPAEIGANQVVIDAYLGSDDENVPASGAIPSGAPIAGSIS